VRLAIAAVPNGEVEDIILANVRTPAERRGDLRAQVAANLRGVTRLAELAARHGAGELLGIMQEVMDLVRASMPRCRKARANATSTSSSR
jgi:N-methylhydantoinase B